MGNSAVRLMNGAAEEENCSGSGSGCVSHSITSLLRRGSGLFFPQRRATGGGVVLLLPFIVFCTLYLWPGRKSLAW